VKRRKGKEGSGGKERRDSNKGKVSTKPALRLVQHAHRLKGGTISGSRDTHHVAGELIVRRRKPVGI